MGRLSRHGSTKRLKFVSVGTLKKLDHAANGLTERIRQKIVHTGKSGARTAKWGQFIDDIGRTSGQVGVFGTAGAAFILRSEKASRLGLFEAAARSLPGWSGTLGSEAFSDSELDLSLKCAAILSAHPHDVDPDGNQEIIEKRLVAMSIEGGGWGYFAMSAERIHEDSAEIIPTAQVILPARVALIHQRSSEAL